MLTDEQLAERIGPRLRNELATIEPPGDLLTVLHRRQTRRSRAVRAATIAAVPLAAVATAVAVTMTSLSAAPSSPVITVRELAYRAAAAAAAQPYLRPGQWVHWVERVAGGPHRALQERTIQQWTTADARKFAVVSAKAVRVEDSTCLNPGKGPSLIVCPGNHEVAPMGNGWSLGFGWGSSLGAGLGWMLPVSYASLSRLPRRPQALDTYLASLHESGGWSQPVVRISSSHDSKEASAVYIFRISSSHDSKEASAVYSGVAPAGWRPPAPFHEFVLIEQMLASFVMPPRLTAELYRAVALIPGVTVDTHAVDVADRPGVSFTMKVPADLGEGVNEIIFNPHTFHLMGQQVTGFWNAHTRVLSGTAILGETPVSGPGVQP